MIRRILFLCAEMGGFGGVERLIANLAPLLNDKYDVHVASFDPPGTLPGVQLAVPFHPLGGEKRRPVIARPITYLDQVSRLRELEQKLSIDVTISNLWRADMISALAGGQTRRIALTHINIAGNPTNQLMIRLRPFVAFLYRRFSRVVTVSDALNRELTGLYNLNPSKVRTIWNPVTPAADAPAPSSGNRIIWCGRMVPEKNLEPLIAAFAQVHAKHPEVKLDLVGDGPERHKIEACARKHDLSIAPATSASVVLHGRIADPSVIMAGGAALVLPSRAEGFGLVLVEAMALGVPVLAADCSSGGVHEVLAAKSPHDPDRPAEEEVASGLLLPVPRDPASIARWAIALDKVLTDAASHAQWREGALARAADFAPDLILAKWTGLLSEPSA